MEKRACNSCGHLVACRRVQLFVELPRGGVHEVLVSICGACAAALLDSIKLFSVRDELPLMPPPR